jgi:pullulanase/glycogen debranching enzyme
MERACKHLKLELSKEPSLQGTVFALILSDSHHTTAYRVSKETESIIGYSEDTINEWINVYAKDTTSKYDKFGYSVDEQRWSSNKMPIKADAIETLIKEVIVPIIEGEEQEEDDESAVELNSDELENAMREFGVTLDSIIEEGIIYEMEIFALKMVMSPIRKYLIVPPFNELVIAMSKILENENYTKKDEREKLVSVIKDVRKKTK